MPLLKDIVVIKHSHKADKDKEVRPFNELTAALAREEAVEDMKKSNVPKKLIKLLIALGILYAIFQIF